MTQISENLKTINDQIASLCEAYERAPESVHLVAVSKKQPQQKIEEALAAGHRLFGENRVQEAIEHWSEIKGMREEIRLHLIGPLQTNKVKQAVELFDCIETVDRKKLADALLKEMQKQGRMLPCFIQVNTGEEEQKAGILPSELDAFVSYCRQIGLPVCGLMCIPPVDEPPALHFAFLKKLAARNDLSELSMGMSSDYEKAIPLGATYIRVGTAIFGERD